MGRASLESDGNPIKSQSGQSQSEVGNCKKWNPRCEMTAGVTGNKETICQG